MPASLELRSAYSRLPRHEPAVNYTAITIRPDPTIGYRPPVQLALVLDISGSMAAPIALGVDPREARLHDVVQAVHDARRGAARKIDLAKAAAAAAVERLHEGDVICIVSFSGKASVPVPAQPIAGDRRAILDAIGRMRTQGGTNMARGIAAAHEQLAARAGEEAVRKIVVLTDGRTRDERRCRQLAEQTAIPYLLGGIGQGYNHRLLEEMARRSRGRADYIDRAEAVEAFFGEAVAAAQATALTGAVLRMRFRAHFRPRRMHQVLPEIVSYDFAPVTAEQRDTQVALGDVQREGMTLLVEYLYEATVGLAAEFQVAGLQLEYAQPPRSGLQVSTDDWTIQLAGTPGFPTRDPDVARLIDRAAVVMAQRDLLAAAQAGDGEAARRQLDALQQRLQRAGADAALIEQTVSTMRLQLDARQAPESLLDSAAAKRLANGTRKLSLPEA